jgi:hypothetical protein
MGVRRWYFKSVRRWYFNPRSEGVRRWTNLIDLKLNREIFP